MDPHLCYSSQVPGNKKWLLFLTIILAKSRCIQTVEWYFKTDNWQRLRATSAGKAGSNPTLSQLSRITKTQTQLLILDHCRRFFNDLEAFVPLIQQLSRTESWHGVCAEKIFGFRYSHLSWGIKSFHVNKLKINCVFPGRLSIMSHKGSFFGKHFQSTRTEYYLIACCVHHCLYWHLVIRLMVELKNGKNKLVWVFSHMTRTLLKIKSIFILSSPL